MIGAGAIGCTLAARLAASGQPVNMLTRGAALAAIRANGIRLHDLEGEHQMAVNASADSADFGVQDVIFICTKADALTALMPAMRPLIGADTLIVPLVNGLPWWYFQGQDVAPAARAIGLVDPDGAVAAALGATSILGCVVMMTAEALAPGVVRSNNKYLITLGELDNQLSARLQGVCAMLLAAGIEARATDNIRQHLWTKMIMNLSSNPLSVVAGATLEQIYTDPGLQTISANILAEAAPVAAAYGVTVDLDRHKMSALGSRMGAVRTSMLQDYQHGRPLELAAIGEAILEMASHRGLAMPVTRNVLAVARFRSAAARAA